MTALWHKANELPTPFLEWASSSSAGEFIIISPLVAGEAFLVATPNEEGANLLQGEAISTTEAAAFYNPETHEAISGEEAFAWTPISF